jgi:hypothetical protein
MIDISGLDKASVIQALYAGTHQQGLGRLHFPVNELSREEAESLVGVRIDYLHGRVMKVCIPAEDDPDSFFELLYDRDNGQGAAARIVAALRSSAHE